METALNCIGPAVVVGAEVPLGVAEHHPSLAQGPAPPSVPRLTVRIPPSEPAVDVAAAAVRHKLP
jgi:hypothetical protein